MFGDREKNVKHQKTTEEKKGVEYKVSSLICGKNDLETWCVENGLEYILFEWDDQLNGNLRPSGVARSSNKPVWWKCKKCEKSYQTSPGHRTGRGSGCPICAKEERKKSWAKPKENMSFSDLFPEIAKEWDPANDKAASSVKRQSRYNAKWICSKCGNHYSMSVYSRTGKKGHGCPLCARKKTLIATITPTEGKSLLDLYPSICEEWDYEKNGTLLPSQIKAASLRKVWWKCKKQGHEWLSDPAHRIRSKNGCPRCSAGLRTSYPEKVILYYVKKYLDNQAENNVRPEWLMKKELDIYSDKLKIAVEYDGVYYHSDVDSDLMKNKLCKEKGIQLYRIREKGCKELNDSSIDFYVLPNKESDLEMAIIWLLNHFSISSCDINIANDLCEIYKMVDLIEKDNSIANSHMIDEWNYEKNTISPQQVARSSMRKVWWKCKNGHEWIQSPNSRKNYECPYCTKKRVTIGDNDLASLYPEIASEWNTSKNKEYDMHLIAPFSNKKVWWKCKNGHEWKTSVANRTLGKGCPFCTNKRILSGYNDLATLQPDLLLDWDYSSNSDDPTKVSCKSGKMINWKCHLCGNKWAAKISQRVNGTGCPQCAIKRQRIKQSTPPMGKALQDLYPNIAIEWDYDKNEKTPADYYCFSSSYAYWKCSKCGNSYKAIIGNRTKGHGCPKCSIAERARCQSLAPYEYSVANNEKLLQDWDYDNNNEKPDNVYAKSNIKKNWKCHVCGYQWSTSPNNKNRSGCPQCIKKRKQRPVINLDTGIIYESINEAAIAMGKKSSGQIIAACKEKSKTAAGFHWAYYEIE